MCVCVCVCVCGHGNQSEQAELRSDKPCVARPGLQSLVPRLLQPVATEAEELIPAEGDRYEYEV